MATVVVIDDDEGIREAVGDALELAGYSVVSCDGRSALDVLRAAPRPCTALLDLVMPGIDGVRLRRTIADDPELASLPIVACTAYRVEEALAATADAGPPFVAILRKPFTEEQLLAAVARAFAPA